MIKSKLSWQTSIPIIIFLVLMMINFMFVNAFWFGGSFWIDEPFLRIGIFMISLMGSISILYDLTFNLTLFRLKEETFEIRTIFKKDEIPYRAIYYLYEEEDVFRLHRNQILTVQTKKSKFKLRSFFDSNYDQVKTKLTEKAEQYVNLLD
ncbi:hypothetical protein IF128_03865 [Empedobacter stercoris]|uniref:hypothetical protein n=1 Tax=Empedobacter stercoris TaxID=1628248 RepID=UPI0016627304|nr:hypothetical protein [Empedobacter stercoris]MCA4808892.1 hypothetical protein [Empedobacter stercoris]QNT15416.1 hypothetical protein HNV03_12545 [Empedobacter stercoris]